MACWLLAAQGSIVPFIASFYSFVEDNGYSYAGDYVAMLGSNGQTANMQQIVPAVAGGVYNLSFALSTTGSVYGPGGPAPDVPNFFAVYGQFSSNGATTPWTTLYSATNLVTNAVWGLHMVSFTAPVTWPSVNVSIQLSWSMHNIYGTFYLDNVNLVGPSPIPPQPVFFQNLLLNPGFETRSFAFWVTQ